MGKLWRAIFKRKRNLAIIAIMVLMPIMAPLVSAQDNNANQGTTVSGESKYIGAALAVGISSLGAGIAISGATSAGIAAIVEKPELTTWTLIFAALGEGLAIYGLVISIMILGA